MDRETIQQRLKAFGQQHLLAFWDTLSDVQQQRLLEQLAGIDFPLVDQLFRAHEQQHDWAAIAARAEPPPAIRLDQQHDPQQRQAARAAGERALRAGRVAAIMVAGGQGTRLGFPHPKGVYPIGPVSGRTLYQMHLDQLRAVSQRYGRPVPLCLMTSPATDLETRQALPEAPGSGFPAHDLLIFQQGTMPAVNEGTGQVLLDAPDSVALSPDGHGGMLAALAGSGGLDWLRERGVAHIYYFQVDNPLLTLCDPVLIGWHLLHQSEMTTQVVAKTHPLDRVGNVAVVDGKMQVIEYSDLPDEQAERATAGGQLVFWAGNVAVHVLELDFLRRMARTEQALPFHRAHKKVPYLDPATGRRVEPEQANAIKFERFIFDLMPEARNPLVVEVDPRDEFAPLKNASGHAQYTPESVRQALADKHRRWLVQAGARVEPDVPVEIHPLFALDADELRAKLPEGYRIDSACYLSDGTFKVHG